ncbi:hypothetical protein Lal_00025355 [Lupinus albus]|nr:hypothetical protein Lal_00025355 [Lupinus albus]
MAEEFSHTESTNCLKIYSFNIPRKKKDMVIGKMINFSSVDFAERYRTNIMTCEICHSTAGNVYGSNED